MTITHIITSDQSEVKTVMIISAKGVVEKR